MFRIFRIAENQRILTPAALFLHWLGARIFLFLVLMGVASLQASPVSFRNDVMAVLSKAGCNAGTCHGNKNGKGGFKLSLRGQDPETDFATLTHDLFARRTDALNPDESLILLKPTSQLAHEGGTRFRKDSELYQLLREWIASGMRDDAASAPKLQRIEITPKEKILVEPEAEVQLEVHAMFSDGSSKDITKFAVYETSNALAKVSPDGKVGRERIGETTVLVRYLHLQAPVRIAFVAARPDFRWASPPSHNYIDDHVFSKLRTLRTNPSQLCGNDVFLRRAYLDLLGILPTAEEARVFLRSSAENVQADENAPAPFAASEGGAIYGSTNSLTQRVRAQLIDELLGRPEFADFWALKWADLLRVEAHSLDQKGVQSFHHWIRQSIAENKPLDQFVRELITARGSTYLSPAANYYRPNRDPASRAKATAQILMGARLQCAECHNHPSDRWTQDDYYDWAALFARVNYKVLENKREIGSDQHEWNGEQVIFLSREGRVKNPRTSQDANPRFLGSNVSLLAPGPQPVHPASDVTQAEPLGSLAAWLTSAEHPLFARVQVNRIWYHLMGRGLVDPPDDFRATNPASHPALLDALARDFVEHGFDLRYVIRLIMTSRTYQVSSEPNDSNENDEMNFSHALVRRLGAEQLLDCQSQVTGVPLKFSGYPAGFRAAQLPGVRPESKSKRRANPFDQFLEIFGKPPRLLTTDSERSCECNMGQVFQMINGPPVNALLAEKENCVSRLLTSGKTNREIVDELFWTALTRPPTPPELETILPELQSDSDRREKLQDVLWALLNSKDFVFRQ